MKALPKIRFDLMNTVNASTGFSGFQVWLGQSPRFMPPIVNHADLPEELRNTNEAALAEMVIESTNLVESEARDNMIA